jgi:hypothetical protein
MKLGVVIVNWNTAALLRACLLSLRQFPPDCSHAVVVVDNFSTDGSAEMVRHEFPEVHLIAERQNLGYAEGNNRGFAALDAELVLTLNPDTEVYTDTFAAALEHMKNHPDTAVLGAKQIGVDGRVQRSVRGFPSFWGIFGEITGLARVFPGSVLAQYRRLDFDYDTLQTAPQPMGTFLLFRRSALAKVSDPRAPFDPAFPIFFNEVDLLVRLHQAGEICRYDPNVRILHHGGESTRQVRPQMIWESHRSLMRYMQKHPHPFGGRVGAWVLSPLVWLGALIRARGLNAGFRP